MKKMALVFPVFLTLVLLAGCGGDKPEVIVEDVTVQAASPAMVQPAPVQTPPVKLRKAAITDGHSAQTSLDYYGVYEGVLPAADGPGIKTRLILGKDNMFELRSEYLGKKGGVFVDGGVFFVEGNLLVLEMQNASGYYRLGEGKLTMLSQDKQEVTGPLADMYVLKQVQIL